MESSGGQSRNWLLIPTTFLAAFILTLLPMPDWTVWLRPAWILMVLIYWIMMMPHRINLGTAWILGVFLDVLNGTILGEHALALTLAAYVVARMHSRMRMFSLFQQGLCVLLIVFFISVCLILRARFFRGTTFKLAILVITHYQHAIMALAFQYHKKL